MIKKFNDDEFNLSRGIDYLTFECLCCNTDFKLQKKAYVCYLNGNYKGSIKYCSKACSSKMQQTKVEKECMNCGCIVYRQLCQLKKTKNSFCSKSCAAKFNNKNKSFGTRRSKLEAWIEENLKSKYKFDIVFNGKTTIGSELDVYIPSLKLAFELNGIFHYEPIFGKTKLDSVINNDSMKYKACIDNNIDLCIIDVSGSKRFKPERDIKYLEIIENIIKTRLVE